MKRAASPLFNDSKTQDCITKFQLIPPNLVTKDNPIFSAFSKNRFRKHLLNDVHDVRNNNSANLAHQMKTYDQNSNKSLLLGRRDKQACVFQGLLKARKSHIKKIKLKEFYLEEHDEKKESEQQKYHEDQTKINRIKSKNSTQFNTIDSKTLQPEQKQFLLPNRKKVLPAKLRAKSYSNFPKHSKDNIDLTNDENLLYVKPKKNQSQLQDKQKLTIEFQNGQNLIKKRCRRSLRSGKTNKIQVLEQKGSKVLADISLKFNQQQDNIMQEKDLKSGFHRNKRHRKGLKSQCLTKLDSNFFDLNPWGNNHNEDDKQNLFFIYS